jgi:shikimate dehydrogenase
MAAATRAAVLGSPIAHSLSPALHTAAYRELGLTDWSYQAIECDERSLAGLLNSLGPEWAGLSLTMPLKRAVLPLLDRADNLVTEVGAANTVLLRGGRRLGYNTDVPGMVTALRQAGVTSAGNVVVLGGGATACSALAALRELGAANIAVAVRDLARAGPVREVAARLGLTVRLTELAAGRLGQTGGRQPVGAAGSGPAADLAGQSWQLLISTVPAGAADDLAGLLGAGQLADGVLRADVLLDVVYDPWPTLLAEAAAAVGSTVISGFEMLVHQAAAQVELMTGHRAPTAAMRAAGLAELKRRRNIC